MKTARRSKLTCMYVPSTDRIEYLLDVNDLHQHISLAKGVVSRKRGTLTIVVVQSQR